MSVLAIDIGNSRIGLNVYTRGKSQDAATRLTHAQLDADLDSTLQSLWAKAQKETADNATDDSEDSADITEIVIASVVPALTARLEATIRTLLHTAVQVIGRDLFIPIKTTLKDESTVGQDRLLAALAAYVNVESACAIVQAGSALVVDCVDDEGLFRGGAIAPGLAMAAHALHDFAAQLPLIPLTPPDDDQPFGQNTPEAITLGLHVGLRGAVRELIERYATALGSWPHVVATGGDAQSLLAPTQLVDSYIPDLVLQGAALTWEHHRQTQ
jgi:type III pantothenate kinase